jgi:hypothetical protein
MRTLTKDYLTHCTVCRLPAGLPRVDPEGHTWAHAFCLNEGYDCWGSDYLKQQDFKLPREEEEDC